jgi:putative methionine-R-sulfoxide reductase with GAF domain
MQTLTPTSREPLLPPPTRRRSVRLKVHTPAYVSLNGDSSGQVLDLSEIVDISEDGMAIQTSFPLQAQRRVNLCLDLTATRACIHTSGEVIWVGRSGRVGIRFPQMPDDSRRQLKEWLFLNAMIACANHRAEQKSEFVPTAAAPAKPVEASPFSNWMRHELDPAAPADYTSILAALAAVKREAESLGSDLDHTLQLIAGRAQTFTRATGAAIALTAGPEMICRASAGHDAPGLGARLTIGAGFSGECVRSGQLRRCEDAETDPLVDRESCRALGIRSMIAVPIRWNEAVIGLLEVFSPEPNAFPPNDDLVLKRLSEIVSTAVHRAGAPSAGTTIETSEPETTEASLPKPTSPQRVETTAVKPQPVSRSATSVLVDDEFPVETTADLPLPHFSRARKLLLLAVAATVLVALSWVISPTDFKGFGFPHPASQPSKPASAPPASAPATTNVSAVSGPEGMRKLAEQGDAAAQFAVGARYATGEDVPQDYTEAVRWFYMAAEQGHVVSQATLGAYYWAGRGVQQDLVKAYFWSVLAQAGGDEASKYRVATLASRMTHAQIITAQQEANDWIKEHQTLSQNSQPLNK